MVGERPYAANRRWYHVMVPMSTTDEPATLSAPWTGSMVIEPTEGQAPAPSTTDPPSDANSAKPTSDEAKEWTMASPAAVELKYARPATLLSPSPTRSSGSSRSSPRTPRSKKARGSPYSKPATPAKPSPSLPPLPSVYHLDNLITRKLIRANGSTKWYISQSSAPIATPPDIPVDITVAHGTLYVHEIEGGNSSSRKVWVRDDSVTPSLWKPIGFGQKFDHRGQLGILALSLSDNGKPAWVKYQTIRKRLQAATLPGSLSSSGSDMLDDSDQWLRAPYPTPRNILGDDTANITNSTNEDRALGSTIICYMRPATGDYAQFVKIPLSGTIVDPLFLSTSSLVTPAYEAGFRVKKSLQESIDPTQKNTVTEACTCHLPPTSAHVKDDLQVSRRCSACPSSHRTPTAPLPPTTSRSHVPPRHPNKNTGPVSRPSSKASKGPLQAPIKGRKQMSEELHVVPGACDGKDAPAINPSPPMATEAPDVPLINSAVQTGKTGRDVARLESLDVSAAQTQLPVAIQSSDAELPECQVQLSPTGMVQAEEDVAQLEVSRRSSVYPSKQRTRTVRLPIKTIYVQGRLKGSRRHSTRPTSRVSKVSSRSDHVKAPINRRKRMSRELLVMPGAYDEKDPLVSNSSPPMATTEAPDVPVMDFTVHTGETGRDVTRLDVFAAQTHLWGSAFLCRYHYAAVIYMTQEFAYIENSSTLDQCKARSIFMYSYPSTKNSVYGAAMTPKAKLTSLKHLLQHAEHKATPLRSLTDDQSLICVPHLRSDLANLSMYHYEKEHELSTPGQAMCLEYFTGGRYLAVGAGIYVTVFDTRTGKSEGVFKGKRQVLSLHKSSEINSMYCGFEDGQLVFHRSQLVIALAGNDGAEGGHTVQIWRRKSSEHSWEDDVLLHSPPGAAANTTTRICTLFWPANGDKNTLLVGYQSHGSVLWDLRKNSPISVLSPRRAIVDISAKDDKCLVPNDDQGFDLVDFASQLPIAHITGKLLSGKFIHGGNMLLCGGAGKASLWQIIGRAVKCLFILNHNDDIPVSLVASSYHDEAHSPRNAATLSLWICAGVVLAIFAGILFFRPPTDRVLQVLRSQ
ncbi:hypothetical protein FPV67DRAFT_1457292 [Lyophyllum atratum]|nr:hypothetical protein FPV67DRAFT_1457292 [Lyophyllum atratum]